MGIEEQKGLEEKKAQKDLELTEQNWLFLKHLRLGAKIPEAYKLAGYEGANSNAPYSMYDKIKKKLEMIVKSDGFDRLRLTMEMDKILSLPLAESKQEVTFTEKLKALRLAHTIMQEDAVKSPASQFTMIVIESGQNTTSKADKAKRVDSEVVDADIVDPIGDTKAGE